MRTGFEYRNVMDSTASRGDLMGGGAESRSLLAHVAGGPNNNRLDYCCASQANKLIFSQSQLLAPVGEQ